MGRLRPPGIVLRAATVLAAPFFFHSDSHHDRYSIGLSFAVALNINAAENLNPAGAKKTEPSRTRNLLPKRFTQSHHVLFVPDSMLGEEADMSSSGFGSKYTKLRVKMTGLSTDKKGDTEFPGAWLTGSPDTPGNVEPLDENDKDQYEKYFNMLKINNCDYAATEYRAMTQHTEWDLRSWQHIQEINHKTEPGKYQASCQIDDIWIRIPGRILQMTSKLGASPYFCLPCGRSS